MLLSFKYSIDPQVHKTKEEYKAKCIQGCHPAKALTGCKGLAGSALQDEGVPPEHLNVTALFVCNAFTLLN